MSTKTLYLNLFAGPCCGKTAVASGLFFALKCMSFDVEYVTEYAKELVWAERSADLKCQPYVTAKQFYKQYLIQDKVDIALVDSPILLGVVYPGFGSTPNWEKATFDHFNLFNNLNIVLTRSPELYSFNSNGRNEKEEQDVLKKDQEILSVLSHYNVPHLVMAPLGLEEVTFSLLRLILLTQNKSVNQIFAFYYIENDTKFYIDFSENSQDLSLISDIKLFEQRGIYTDIL